MSECIKDECYDDGTGEHRTCGLHLTISVLRSSLAAAERERDEARAAIRAMLGALEEGWIESADKVVELARRALPGEAK